MAQKNPATKKPVATSTSLRTWAFHIWIFHNGHPYLTPFMIELNLTQDLPTTLTTELL